MNTRALFKVFNLTILLIGLIYLNGCKTDTTTTNSNFTVKTRLAIEPDRLNPLLSYHTPSVIICQYIFMPLAEVDPESMELNPLLIESIPEPVVVSDGPYQGDDRYTFQIREQAKWSDGAPITAADYLFTVKAVRNPFANTAVQRGSISEIKDIILDPSNPRSFSVVVENDYFLGLESASTFHIIPKHIYDEKNILDQYSLSELQKINQTATGHEELRSFTSEFSSAKYSRDVVVGSGPYQLEQWITNQSISLSRVEDWWGNDFESTGLFFHNDPSQIEFVIIADEVVALTALKDGQIDFLPEVSPDRFKSLQNDEVYKDKLNYKTSSIPKYYFIGLNIQQPTLADKKIRRALVHIFDNKALIDDVALGFGQSISGPFSPATSYYNSDLKLLDKDYKLANDLIQSSGWRDSNQNGIVDKTINNQLVELELDIFVTNKALGQKIGLLLQEGGKKVGIKINIIKKDFSLIRKDLHSGSYDMAALVAGFAPTPSDPYQSWHTDNIGNGGGNISKFGNEKSDELIRKIRMTKNASKRDQYYKDLQKIIYDEQPYIFLYAPVSCILANKKFDFDTYSLRPGYFFNTFNRAS